MNPQKNSPALGATLAYLGVDRMLALLHGAQGCSTFIRLQLSRHFKESIALNSTAMSEDAAIFGGWKNLQLGIARVIEKFRPGVVGVMTSGLTETMGDDVRAAIAQFRAERPEHAGVPIVWASTRTAARCRRGTPPRWRRSSRRSPRAARRSPGR